MQTLGQGNSTGSQTAVAPTTFVQSVKLNRRLGAEIVLACETFQVTGSFKFRAAYNVAANIAQQHLIAASSGNFGQALAYACSLLGKRCTVVMPDDSARVKIEAVKEFGAQVVLIDTFKQSRADEVNELMREFPQAYCASAYDDELVIEGNATLGRELAAVVPAFDVVVVPVGGGGLCAGIIKGLSESKGVTPKVIGAEPKLANDFARSFKAGQILVNETEPKTIADGVRTVSVGKNNWQYLKTGLADVLEVAEESIIKAWQLLFFLANVKAEPTGAVSLAAVLENVSRFAGLRVCCIVSGGNVDQDVLQRLLAWRDVLRT